MRTENFPKGWMPAGVWSEQGAIVSVPAGSGVSATAYTTLVSRVIPASAKVYVEKLYIRVVDMSAYDQVFFALRRNGARLAPWEKINGEQFVEEFTVDVGEVFGGGMLEIIASNISGVDVAIEPTATPDAVAIRCIARIKGMLLHERKLRGM